MKHFLLISCLCFLSVSALSALTNTALVISLQSAEEYRFVPIGTTAFPGANAIYAQDSVLILASNRDVSRSTDGGVSWKSIAEPLRRRNPKAILLRKDTIYAVSANGVVERTTNNGLDWKVVDQSEVGPYNNTPTSTSGVSTRCSDIDVHIVDSTLTLTSWTGPRVIRTNPNYVGISAVATNDSIIYVAKRREGVFVLDPQYGALTSVKLQYLEGESISAMTALDSYLYLGVRTGKGGVHRKHIDGRDWEPVATERKNLIVDVTTLVPSQRGVYVGTQEHGVFLAKRNARTMQSISDGLNMAQSRVILKLDTNVIIGCHARSPVILKTNTATAEELTDSIPVSFAYHMSALSGSLFLGLGNGTIMRSVDMGRTWDSIPKRMPKASLNQLVAGTDRLVAATSQGAWVTTDLGQSWASLHQGLEDKNVRKVFVGDNMALVLTNAGTHIVRPDGQLHTYDTTMSSDNPYLVHDAVFVDGTIYAVGFSGMMVSKDMGRSWSHHDVLDKTPLRAVTISNRRIYVSTAKGLLLSCPLP